jgi:flagellar assembly protein FliH
MPSLPDAASLATAGPDALPVAVTAWEPVDVADLARPTGTSTWPEAPAVAASFVATPLPAPPGAVRAAAPLFEVASGAGIPEDVLAPARDAAMAAGYAAGWASGTQAARRISEAELRNLRARAEQEIAERRVQVGRALEAVRAAADAFEQRAVPAAEHIEDLIVASAFTIAEAVVTDSLRDDATRGAAALTRALALAPAGARAVVALNPDDYALLAGASLEQSGGREIELVADPSLAPGEARATCGSTTIDARIAAGLARAREVLGQ